MPALRAGRVTDRWMSRSADMPVHCFDRAELPTMPWKNGGGVTREIGRVPSGADLEQFDWRVSIAQVTSDGPFSSFPGIDRVITLLDGAGMRLFGASEKIDHYLDRMLTPWAFPGEALLQCSLLGADCEDFNVMTRRSRCRAEVQVLKLSQKLQRANGGVLLACGGRVMLEENSGRRHLLAPAQGLWWHDEPFEWELQIESDTAVLLAATIHSVSS